jgi:hypothetical protein
MGLVIALVAGGLLLLFAGIAAAAVYFLVFAKPAPHLAKYVPKTTSVYVELPGVKRSLISSATMKPLDPARVDEKQMMEDTITAFSNSFSLSQEEAKRVVDGLDAAAFAARDTNNKGKAVMLLSFSSATAADTLLKSRRFTDDGSYGTDGERFKLDPKAPTGRTSHNLLEQALDDMSATGKKEPVVWFKKKKLVAFGDDEMVADVDSVLGGGSESLEKSDAYRKAKSNFESGSDVAFFFDTHDLDDAKGADAQKMLDGYLRNRDPITGAIKLVKAGIMMDVHATLSGGAMPPEDLIAHAPKLAFPHKLPGDTIAYMAYSTKTKMKGAAVVSTMLDRIADNDPRMAKDAKDGLDAMNKALGFTFEDVVDMTGDEMAFGVLLDPTFKLDTTNGITDELANVGMVWALAIKDDDKARMVLGKIRKRLEDKDVSDVATIRSIGTDGFEVDPQTSASFPIPNLTVKYDGKAIVAVLAAGSLTSRAFDALQKGKGTLADQPAHELAFGALPQDANFYMWLDTGRITSVMMDGVTHAHRSLSGSMLPLDAVRLTGPDRVTSAVALRMTSKSGGVWAVDLDSLNLPATALFSIASELNLSSAMPSGPIFGVK